MSILLYILVFTFIGSIASLIGGVFLLVNKNLCKKLTPFFVAFAAGTLITVALIDLIPEAVETFPSEPRKLFVVVLGGLVSFFLLERYIFWHHHHDHGQHLNPTSMLIIIGDTLHNFIDGMAIAASFMVGVPVGIATSIAVGMHEIPQEIGDFGALLALGFARRTVLLVNIVSAMSALLGAVLGFYFLGFLENLLPYLLAYTGGHFIYIAASDLIPEMHSGHEEETNFNQTFVFLLSILITYSVIAFLE